MTNPSVRPSKPLSWLRAVALDRKETFSWAIYDWANSAFATTIIATVLPIYYASVAASDLAPNVASAYWGYTTSIALLLIALVAPILGAMADFMGAKSALWLFLLSQVLSLRRCYISFLKAIGSLPRRSLLLPI